jgi:multidrug efflux pump subunit AcrB
MISSLFIRRPRLALVISFVITLAGLLALAAIPIAQFPDIVPPQVQVTATYPGASATAVEASVGQVIESQVNGVERMIYMKSMSGGDGSYTLNISFEVGTNPDIAAVNARCRPRWAAPMSTTSIASGGRGRSRCRPTPPIARRSMMSSE